MHTLSVSSLNEQIKTILETSFNRVLVEGELSRITFHNSGHIYFTLKDSSSTLKAVMFRGNASKLKFKLQEGIRVILDGAITLYKPRGEYQINCFSIEPYGQGALALAYEQLKAKLYEKGYFLAEYKKKLSVFPKKIALITSATGAALQDMLRVAENRYRLLEIDIYDVLVQGDSAALSISNAIILADTRAYDIIVIGRGGGSIEDLWAFNEEIVADAVYNAKTPIVSAVGHEIDTVISDFVADLRAPTPSSAMEMILPDSNELLIHLDSVSNQLSYTIEQKIFNKKQILEHLLSSYSQNSIEKKITLKIEQIKQLEDSLFQGIGFKLQKLSMELESEKQRFPQAIDTVFNIAQNQVDSLEKMLESNHPKHKNKKGFAQVSLDSTVIDISILKVDDIFDIMNDKVILSAKVLYKNNI